QIIVIRNRPREEFAHEHRKEGVQRDNADKEPRDPFDGIDEAVHDVLARRLGWAGERSVAGGLRRCRHESPNPTATVLSPGKSAKRVFSLDVPAIHVLSFIDAVKTWMPGT